MLDKLTKVLSFSTILMVLLGVYNLHLKYYWTGIKIFDYADASEIFFSFSEIVIIIFACVSMGGLILAMKVGSVAGSEAVERPGKEITYETIASYTNFNKWGCILISFGLIMTIVWTVIVVRFFLDIELAAKWNSIWFDGLYLTACVIILAAKFALDRSSSLFIDIEKEALHMVWSIFMALLIFFPLRNYLSWSLKNSGIPKYQVALTFKDNSMMVTTKNRIYIDQSRNFIFFREVETNTYLVVPMQDVKNIRMSLLHKGL